MPSLGGTNNVGELSAILQLKIDDREWRADRESDQDSSRDCVSAGGDDD